MTAASGKRFVFQESAPSQQSPVVYCPFCSNIATISTTKPLKLQRFVERCWENKHVLKHLRDETTAPNIARFCKRPDSTYQCIFHDCRTHLPHLVFPTYGQLAKHIHDHCLNHWLTYKHCLTDSESHGWDNFLVSVYSEAHQAWFSHAWILDIYLQNQRNYKPNYYQQTPYYNPDKHPSVEMFILDYSHSDWSMQFDFIDARFQEPLPPKQQAFASFSSFLPMRSHDDDDEDSSSSSSSYADMDSIDEHIYVKQRKDGTFKSVFTDPALKPLPDHLHPFHVIH